MRILSAVSIQLFSSSEGRSSTEFARFLNKFEENDFEKLKFLVQLHKTLYERVKSLTSNSNESECFNLSSCLLALLALLEVDQRPIFRVRLSEFLTISSISMESIRIGLLNFIEALKSQMEEDELSQLPEILHRKQILSAVDKMNKLL